MTGEGGSANGSGPTGEGAGATAETMTVSRADFTAMQEQLKKLTIAPAAAAPALVKFDAERLSKSVEFLVKNPDAREDFMKQLDAATGGTAQADVAALKVQLAREKAQRVYGIDDDDAEAFLTSGDPAVIMQQAKRLSERLKTQGNAAAPEGEDAEDYTGEGAGAAPGRRTVAGIQIPAAPEYGGTSMDREKAAARKLFEQEKKKSLLR